jgi:hypothetical protein
MNKIWEKISFSMPQKAVLFIFSAANILVTIYEIDENDGQMVWYYMLAALISLLLAFKKKEAS